MQAKAVAHDTGYPAICIALLFQGAVGVPVVFGGERVELRGAAAGFHAGGDALLVTEHVIGGVGGVAIAVH